MRILITGSRDWDDSQTILRALFNAARQRPEGEAITLVHGGAHGADRIAAAHARNLWWEIEVHPADWATHGKAAGPLRNAAMVEQGADICLAFILNNSRGATGCADLAERAGIPTRRFLA